MHPTTEGTSRGGEAPVSVRPLPRHVTMMRRLARQLPRGRFKVVWEPALRVPDDDGSTLLTDTTCR